MAKKKRRKRKPRISKGKLVPIESPQEQRKKLPKELIDAYLAVKESGWEDEDLYQLYKIEADKYLGKVADDRLESGRLVVVLAKATMDLYNGKAKKEEKEEE